MTTLNGKNEALAPCVSRTRGAEGSAVIWISYTKFKVYVSEKNIMKPTELASKETTIGLLNCQHLKTDDSIIKWGSTGIRLGEFCYHFAASWSDSTTAERVQMP